MFNRVFKLAGLTVITGIAFVAVATSGAAAAGIDPITLQQQGWVCDDLGDAGLHCDSRGVRKRVIDEAGNPIETASWPELVFEFNSATQKWVFVGTEVGINKQHWQGQPCPADRDVWVDFAFWMFCHHYDSPF